MVRDSEVRVAAARVSAESSARDGLTVFRRHRRPPPAPWVWTTIADASGGRQRFSATIETQWGDGRATLVFARAADGTWSVGDGHGYFRFRGIMGSSRIRVEASHGAA